MLKNSSHTLLLAHHSLLSEFMMCCLCPVVFFHLLFIIFVSHPTTHISPALHLGAGSNELVTGCHIKFQECNASLLMSTLKP